MHVVFGVKRQVKVKYRRHVFNVQPAGGHVGAHQQLHLPGLKRLQGPKPLVLAFVAVQRRGLQAVALKRTRQAGAAQFAVNKHKRLPSHLGLFAHQLHQGAALVVVGYANEALLNRGCRGVGLRHLHRHRVA